MEMTVFADFHFIRPYWLAALLPTMLLTLLLLKNKLRQGNWSDVCDAELLPFILQQKPGSQSHWMLSTAVILVVLGIFALAGPTWERLPSPVFRNDNALVIALDLSQSMNSQDIKPSRLARARYKIADILKQRKDGQTALLVYAGDAFTVTPLTDDSETIRSQLSALTTGIMPAQGSNTLVALGKAVDLLKQAGLQTGDILLITDEVDFPKVMDNLAQLNNYQLSILGVGTPEGAPIKLPAGGLLKDSQGNIVLPKLNATELSTVAIKAGGRYVTLSGDDSDIEQLTEKFNKPLRKQGEEENSLLIDQWDEKGPWLVLLLIPLAALQFRKGLLSIVLLLCLPFPENSYALEWKGLWQTQDQQAQQAFQQQQYEQAAEQFESARWKAAAQYKAGQYEQSYKSLEQDDSATGWYNKGNALAQMGQFAEAVKAYQKSLQKNPDNEDALFNKEQVEKQLQQQQKQQQSSDNNSQSDDQQQQSEQSDHQHEQSEQSENSEPSSTNGEQDEQQKHRDAEPQQSEQSQADQHQQEDEENTEQSEQDEAEAAQQALESKQPYDESEQANEQWLKRIPDDPAGLLKRKFKYQYGQRGGKPANNQAW